MCECVCVHVFVCVYVYVCWVGGYVVLVDGCVGEVTVSKVLWLKFSDSIHTAKIQATRRSFHQSPLKCPQVRVKQGMRYCSQVRLTYMYQLLYRECSCHLKNYM